MMKRTLFLILMFLIVSVPAFADRLSGGGYTLYTTINSGGQVLTNGSYNLIDSKGEPLGGIMSNGGYTFIPGILGLLGGEGPVGPSGPSVLIDNGQIQKTWIERLTNPGYFKIHWTYADQNVSGVDIWILTTPTLESFKEKDRASLTWYKIDTKDKPVNEILFTSTIPGFNFYFRIIPKNAAANSSQLFGSSGATPFNTLTAAKIDVYINPGLNLFTMPLLLTSAGTNDANHIDTRITNVMEGQLVSGDDFYNWTGSSLDISSNSGGTWTKENKNVNIGNGFWVNTPTGRYITLVGIIPIGDFSDQINPGLNLIGYPFPLDKLGIDKIGFAAASGDDFYYWSETEKSLKIISNSGGWPTDNPNLILRIGKGNWYNTTSLKNRSLQNPRSLYQQ